MPRIANAVRARLPRPLHALARKHRELLKFVVVGGTAFLVDNTVFYGLKLTVLEPKPVTAKIIAVLVATIVSYVLNREWSFRARGGRERRHEAALFFLVSAAGLVISSAPLWISRYVFLLETPQVSLAAQEIADFVSAQVAGTLIAMVFRFWALRTWVFPDERPEPAGPRPGRAATAAAAARSGAPGPGGPAGRVSRHGRRPPGRTSPRASENAGILRP
ncbi:GtrA family protein [Nonomuraea candida]|uniref:GtrA family protein n=1 Tax=Nonomuraea candida TaxID=359159 RepID=UPI001FDF091A|nr:GtrA family protein [Nonomuraea candida]